MNHANIWGREALWIGETANADAWSQKPARCAQGRARDVEKAVGGGGTGGAEERKGDQTGNQRQPAHTGMCGLLAVTA